MAFRVVGNMGAPLDLRSRQSEHSLCDQEDRDDVDEEDVAVFVERDPLSVDFCSDYGRVPDE